MHAIFTTSQYQIYYLEKNRSNCAELTASKGICTTIDRNLSVKNLSNKFPNTFISRICVWKYVTKNVNHKTCIFA